HRVALQRSARTFLQRRESDRQKRARHGGRGTGRQWNGNGPAVEEAAARPLSRQLARGFARHAPHRRQVQLSDSTLKDESDMKILAGVVALALASSASAAPGLALSDAWIRARPGKLPAGGYFTLHNGTATTLT